MSAPRPLRLRGTLAGLLSAALIAGSAFVTAPAAFAEEPAPAAPVTEEISTPAAEDVPAPGADDASAPVTDEAPAAVSE
ncbi:hypothetical protein OOT08_12540, partial [Leucobacter sp. M11]|nr:hypothetical protein [Leucobacter sp. M11]